MTCSSCRRLDVQERHAATDLRKLAGHLARMVQGHGSITDRQRHLLTTARERVASESAAYRAHRAAEHGVS